MSNFKIQYSHWKVLLAVHSRNERFGEDEAIAMPYTNE